jgi:hypothetical protein
LVLFDLSQPQFFHHGQNVHAKTATFAKVAWVAAPDGNSRIRAGEFKQVEFMIRGMQAALMP